MNDNMSFIYAAANIGIKQMEAKKDIKLF